MSGKAIIELLHRFELGIENKVGLIEDRAHETSAPFEARYAFANWNAIPLNPMTSLEYIFGFGAVPEAIRCAISNSRSSPCETACCSERFKL